MMIDFNYMEHGCCQQGWQCPICKHVYSPTTPMCFYCGEDGTTTTDSVTISTDSGTKLRATHLAHDQYNAVIQGDIDDDD